MNNIEGISRNLAVIVGELVLLVVLFILLNRVSRLIFKQIALNPLTQKYKAQAEIVERYLNRLLLLVSVLLAIAIVAFNSYLIYLNTDLLAYTSGLMTSISVDSWLNIGQAVAQILGLLIVTRFSISLLQRLLIAQKEWVKGIEQLKANDDSIESFFTMLNHIQKNGLWLLFGVLTLKRLPFSPVLADWLFLSLRVYLIVSLGRLMVSALTAIVDTLDTLTHKYLSFLKLQEFYDPLRELIPLFKRTLEYIIYVSTATFAITQISFFVPLGNYGLSMIEIMVIVFLTRVMVEVTNLLVNKTMLKQGQQEDYKWQQRLTMAPVIKSAARYLIYFVAFIFILRALDLNTTPILASLGGVGLIIGLGAQPMINDLVSGLFILFENLFLVGDYIETSNMSGYVEAIDIRTTRIRGPNGQLHILRNGQIDNITNYSKDYVFAVVKIRVAYDSDLEHVYRVIEETGQKLKESNDKVLTPTKVRGIDSFGDSEIVIGTRTKVKPGCHNKVARSLRKMIKDAFDHEGITIPFAHQVFILKQEPEDVLDVRASVKIGESNRQKSWFRR